MSTRCPDCERGPLGISGHACLEMEAAAEAGRPTTYTCTNCKQQYRRFYEGGGEFVWAAIAGTDADTDTDTDTDTDIDTAKG